jgi:hypothetical protein
VVTGATSDQLAEACRASAAEHYANRALEASTHEKYESTFRLWRAWCLKTNRPIYLYPEDLNKSQKVFVLFLADQRIYRRNLGVTLAGKASAIASIFKYAGQRDPTKSFIADQFIKGVKKEDGGKGASRPKMPVSRRHLLEGHDRCDHETREGSAMWVCLMLGFLFMLRSNNYALPQQGKPYNPHRLLRRCDITYYTGDKPGDAVKPTEANAHLIVRVAISVRSTKTDQAGQGYTREQWRTTDPKLCVVRALVHHQLLTQDLPEDWPITSFDPQPSLGPARFVIDRASVSNLLKHVSHYLGEDISDFSSHSLRIGGATAMHQKFPDSYVKWFGNWGSPTYLIYCRAAVSQGQLFAQHMVDQDLHVAIEHLDFQALGLALPLYGGRAAAF